MIQSTSSSSDPKTAAAQAIASNQASSAARISRLATDRLSTSGADFIRASIAQEPEVRPEVVARGKQLAADPNYPSVQIMGNVASQILASPDLSEDAS